MSDARTYTEREKVLREQEAFVAGSVWGYGARLDADVVAESRRRYPLPKVTRPRVWVEHPCGMGWKVMGGELWFTLGTSTETLRWRRVQSDAVEHEITPERIRRWADLLANPTEEVEAES